MGRRTFSILYTRRFCMRKNLSLTAVNCLGATGGRSLLQFEFSACSKHVYATSEENCGTIQVPDRDACHWGRSLCCWDGTGCKKTIPATCGFSMYSDGCQWCRTTNVWIQTTAQCLGNTKHQRLTSCESGTFHDTVSKQIPETFKRRIFVGCWKDSSDRAMWKYIGGIRSRVMLQSVRRISIPIFCHSIRKS